MKDPIGLLAGLLEIYSPTGEEAEAAGYLSHSMSSLGYRAEIDETGNVVGRLGQGPRQLLLVGHIDTVPGEIEVRRDGDHLYGRGAVDAKGPLACFVTAAAQLGAITGWTITVVGAVGEEGHSEGAKYLRDHYPPADYLVIGEPSGWQQVVLGYKGSLWLEYAMEQPQAHSAGRDPSACDRAVSFLHSLDGLALEHNSRQSKRFDQLTYSLQEMGSCQDGFTQSARLGINLRLPPGINYAGLEKRIYGVSAPGKISILGYAPAYKAEKNTLLVRSLLAAIRQRGGKPTFVVKSGTSDMNILGPAWNCPALAYGPGDSELDHSPNEHISIGEYLQGIDVLAAALTNLTEESEPTQ